ncbi:antibiotic biosynthesis monooxygenase family protein [Embleya sp. AB8]|uniref:antibiotic biosynthesis monooxygenase family protein n=1 Tax=Embleya sp. AB8 TaxID=3156304 RepID=UPI003C730C54
MTGQVLTEVGAVVAAEREGDLVAAYRELVALPLPDGLLRTELLGGQDGHWRIQTLWRDRAALDAMRASPEGPAAPRLFREVGADPVLALFDVKVHHLTFGEPS